MKIVFFTLLVLLSLQASAGGISEEVKLLSLTETTEDEYTLKYVSTKSDKTFTIHLSYSKLGYMFKAKFLTQEKFHSAISLLKEQLKQKNSVRFGWFGGGPCVIDESKNIYRSDALEIYNEGHPNKGPQVVYAFCEYS
ncbi:MAG: hypothetical protein ABNH30_09200 [Thalassolituus sp.]|jgi:hypothetical protein